MHAAASDVRPVAMRHAIVKPFHAILCRHSPACRMTDAETSFIARTEFIIELARRLHAYGTTAQRLEGAISAVAKRLGVGCEIWSNPTGIILSFSDPTRGPLTDTTRVIRLEPGDIDLRKLCQADAIADRVMTGELDLAAGKAALRALDRPPGRRAVAMTIFSFGLASAAVAALLRTGWGDIATAAVIGWLIGALSMAAATRPRLLEASDAVAALVATLLAAGVASWLLPLTLNLVVVASLIVLLPGLMLTNAVAELTHQHLVSGTARFAGAMATLLKLTFGTVAAMQVVRLLGWQPQEAAAAMLPAWLEWVALGIASYAFAVLFRAEKRDYPLVMAAAWLGYGVTRLAGIWLGAEAGSFPVGVFLAGMTVTAVSNAYARWVNRPGALIRVPGIILLVPGSVGFRSLTFVMERDVMLGLDTAFTLVNALVALVAGILFGNLLMPSRRNL